MLLIGLLWSKTDPTITTNALAQALSEQVYRAVQSTLIATEKYQIAHKPLLAVIDYSLPANQKRLWVFDLQTQQILFHTYVSHGIKSGALHTNYFSNRYNSKASSMGVYLTQKTYYGREGLTLKLQGLDSGFNDNAENRAIVMHGGWYMEDQFIHKYGRSGRSWGCPALPLSLSNDIINTIKDNALLIIYYPDKTWFARSKFLSEDAFFARSALTMPDNPPQLRGESDREAVLFTRLNPKMDEAVLVMPADVYAQHFQQKAPLNRMLRRQINGTEYIALSVDEFDHLSHQTAFDLTALQLVIPTLRMERGYYLTEMKIMNLGPIQSIAHTGSYTVRYANNATVSLHESKQFIRWLGL
jgi:hypothetical protein